MIGIFVVGKWGAPDAYEMGIADYILSGKILDFRKYWLLLFSFPEGFFVDL